jgi:phosphopantothenoylcysteine decarboxylase/phosphopantothenate--cysteine ligase
MRGKTIVLGVSGGIAAYKACELASRLTQSGVVVHVVMTQAATRFVAPLTFQALTHQQVHMSLWLDTGEQSSPVSANSQPSVSDSQYAAMAHIELADSADAVLIAPASADVIARLAHGLADDLLTTLVLATQAPILIAPAMNPTMLAHRATQKNIATLRELGYIVIEPESGRMACEHIGSGRLPETDVLLAALRAALDDRESPGDSSARNAIKSLRENVHLAQTQRQTLAGKTVLVTAGPTREALDPVRFLSNRSSGKMGYAIAGEAARRGARVLLVSGPTRLERAPRRDDDAANVRCCDAARARMRHRNRRRRARRLSARNCCRTQNQEDED